MTSTATYLVDTSAFARLSIMVVSDVLRPRIDAGRVAVTAVTWLEIGYTARSRSHHDDDQRRILERLQLVYGSPRSERRAIEVQQALMNVGQHRAVKLPALLIASTAEVEGLIVLQCDADFDRVATVTDQPLEWVVPAGTVPWIDATHRHGTPARPSFARLGCYWTPIIDDDVRLSLDAATCITAGPTNARRNASRYYLER